MPSAIVEVCRRYAAEEETAILECVHACIVEAFQFSPANRNAVFVVHEPHRFLGRPDCSAPERWTHITLYALPGRSLATKRRLYRLLVERLVGFGIPADCILIRLHELPAENFGVRGGQPLSDIDLGYPVDV